MRPCICGVITSGDAAAIRAAAKLVDLFELRLDLVGPAWTEVARLLTKPWIATNRLVSEGGRCGETEADRIAELMRAVAAGATVVDIELTAPGLEQAVANIKKQAQCLISYHNLESTPLLGRLQEIVAAELRARADICKVATTAHCLDDNAVILELIKSFPEAKITAMAMGEAGQLSRVLGPLVGGLCAYGAVTEELPSAPGQLTVAQLARLYGGLAL